MLQILPSCVNVVRMSQVATFMFQIFSATETREENCLNLL